MDADLKEGLVVGGTFVLVRPLGAGGAGEVWLASDKTLGREVAVKFCRSSDEASAHRFLDEARALASVRHPGVVPVLQFGTDDATGRPFFAMPVFKSTLKERLGEAGRLPENEVASLGISLLDAMAALHEASVVHRDIKPSNILLDDAGKPILADPGPTGGGTREWAAPEQLSPTPDVGAAVDFHALGLVLYRALTGELPPPKGVLPPDIEPPPGTLPRNLAPGPSRGWESLLVALLKPSPEERLADIGRIRASLVRLRRSADARALAKRVARPVLIVLAAIVLALVAAPRARCPRSQGDRDEARPRGQDARAPRAAETKRGPAGKMPASPEWPRQARPRGQDARAPREAETSASPRARCPHSQGEEARPRGQDARAPRAAAPDGDRQGETWQIRSIHKEWARQYANGLMNLLAQALKAPVPDSEGRLVVPDGKVLLSGDIPESSQNAEIVLDGGILRFSPSAKELEKIVGRCEDFIANAPDGVPVPEDFLPTIRGRFVQPIAVTAKGGKLDTADGEISVFVVGPVACDESADGATLTIFGFSAIILNRDSLDPRLKITGSGQIAELGADGRIIRRRWFDYDNPL